MTTPQFPTKVWNGTTPTRTLEGVHATPTAEDFEQLREEVQAVQELLRTLALANLTLSTLKIYVGDGVDASGGDSQATFTGAVVGERVLAVIGQTKAADGNSQASLNSFTRLRPGNDVESVVSVTDKIVMLSGLGNNFSAKTFFAICAPAAVTIATQ